MDGLSVTPLPQPEAQCHEGKELSREGERLERRVVKID
jgi:hypothetical protein